MKTSTLTLALLTTLTVNTGAFATNKCNVWNEGDRSHLQNLYQSGSVKEAHFLERFLEAKKNQCYGGMSVSETLELHYKNDAGTPIEPVTAVKVVPTIRTTLTYGVNFDRYGPINYRATN